MLSFCFINPKSGNTVGKQMLQNLNSIIEIQFYTSNITCFFADIHSCEPLLNIITQVVDKNIKIHIFIAGGDGTAKWVVDLLLDLHISLDRFQFSIIPFGTGNDLSRWLNCGKRINEIKPEACIPMMLTWILERIFAPVKPLSLWKINVETYAEGYVESGKGIVYQDFSSTMISLMSIGLMGAVGMEFEKTNQRGSKRWRNILGYALMSGKYLFAKSNEMNLSKSLKGMKTNSKWISFQRSWLEENSPIEIIIQNVPSMVIEIVKLVGTKY